MPKTLRLLKVNVQPVFVIDDGETVEEANTQPVTITAKQWPTYAETLEEQRAEQEAALNAPEAAPEA